MTDNVPIGYQPPTGGSINVAAQQNGALFSFQSVPAIDGVPVRAATPMPVTDAAAATALGTPGDAAWALTGSATIAAAMKEVALQVAGTGSGMTTLNASFSTGIGAQGTGSSYNPPTGGSGVLGYLSGLLKALTGTLSATLAAGSAIIGKVGIDQTTPGTTNGVVVNSAPFTTPISTATAVAVTASSAYAAGQCVGGLVHLANIFPTAKGGEIRAVRAVVNGAVAESSLSLIAYIFNSAPGSTFNDHSAASIALGDSPKTSWGFTGNIGVVGAAGYPSVVIFGGSNDGRPISIVGTDIWLAVITTGTPTFSTANDVTLIVEGIAY